MVRFIASSHSILDLIHYAERHYPQSLSLLVDHVHQPQLPALLRRFLYDQLRQEDEPSADEIDINDCPEISSKIYVYHSAVASFYAPSDISGIRGNAKGTYSLGHHRGMGILDVIVQFVMEDDSTAGFRGMSVVRVQLFLSFEHRGTVYPCALVHWFKKTSHNPDRKTGMWVVQPERRYTRPVLSVRTFGHTSSWCAPYACFRTWSCTFEVSLCFIVRLF